MIKSKVKTKDGDESITAFNVDEYNPKKLAFTKTQKFRKVYAYSDEFMALDTETSHITDQVGWVYQWAVKFNNDYIYGRTPDEFIKLLEKLKHAYGLNEYKKIIIYIHNAAYDIQYLKMYLLQYDEKMDVLALDNHSILMVNILGFRILCSYKLSNMSLDLFSKTYSEKYIKAVGEVDYDIIRYQDSELTTNDWFYMFSDVASQHDAITGYLKINGYDLASKAPITSTGFVRTDCRHAAEKTKKWHEQFQRMKLSLEQYNLCRQAFMGGITIANYLYANEVIENVGHKDFTSSYPARQMMNYFPMGAPRNYGDVDNMEELQWLLDTYCCVFLLHLENVHIKSGITAPYIPSSKCLSLKNDLKINGKVVYADSLTIAVTELDYYWIKRQYKADNIRVSKMVIFERGQCPDWLKDRVMYYFGNKCKLKKSDPRLYMCSKAMLNGIYGMSATSIIRPEFKLNSEGFIERQELTDEDKEKQLNRYYRSRNSFMPYQLGVYTTAWARNALMEMIEAVGYDNFLYCDTDSVFYKNNEESEKRLKEMNERIRSEAIKAGAYIDDNILGVATDEAPIRRFKALHAKCYAAEELNEKTGEYELHVTIAGIPKKSIKWKDGKPIEKTNAEELGNIDNLVDGFIFKHCGGTRCVYIETPVQIAEINGHKTSFASSAIIQSIEKEISDTMYTVGKDYSLLHYKEVQIYE